MQHRLFFSFMLFLTGAFVQAQDAPFGVYLEPIQIEGLGGLQSYAYGQHEGKWLLVGGRLDGLHRRQPWAAFDVAGNNNQLWVIDPETQQKWTAPITSLPTSVQEQLSSTNMEFHQNGNYLYLIGGYGFNASTNEKITFPSLIAIDVPATISAILSAGDFSTHIRQISDVQFAVTGGHLKKIDDTYYLLGGNRFDGDYNPMGNPTYTQVYTNAIRKFTIQDDGTNITVNHLPTITDAVNLHRRDYNAVEQILPNGSQGLIMFSGVFQPTQNLPFLNCVIVDSDGYTVNNDFQQFYNHYHCAVLPIFSESETLMHNIFFGGIAQYYDNNGTLVQDNNVPFVKTIARVTRNAQGEMQEFKLPIEMPSLLGAGSEFIANLDVPHYPNQVFKLDEFTSDSTHVGYIFGGISSTGQNIFFTNDGTQSSASNQIFKVYVVRSSTSGLHNFNEMSTSSLKMRVYPNPIDGKFKIQFHLNQVSTAKISLYQLDGKLVKSYELDNLTAGENTFEDQISGLVSGSSYLIKLETANETASQIVIFQSR